MLSESAFRRPQGAEKLLAAIREMDLPEIRLMEVCGTHTMAIAKSGLRQVLPGNIRLLSGPGCPVCVTPAGVMDEILRLSELPGVILTTYGDLMRVPGSDPEDSLQRRKALGADIRWVYSPMDSLEIAAEHPERQVVFLGVGFETTAPGTALAVLEAKRRGLRNFSMLCLLKRTEPALRALIRRPDFRVNGFLCPGHVATIIGADGFAFLPQDYKLPAVIAGFEPEDILLAVYRLVKQLAEKSPRLENEYTRAVSQEGNRLAQKILAQCFEPRFDIWRGLGGIEASGLGLREELKEFDAERRFRIKYASSEPPTACCCGEVITGRLSPERCPLFGKACTPEDPVGPCMVSSEGACAAAWKYAGVL